MQSPTYRPRPDNLADFRALVSFMNQSSPLVSVPPLRLDPTDVVVATFPKCGTTWVQQIVHGLRTRGSMDFEEISLVVPWIETAGMLGIDLDAPQVARPRAFKTHLPWDMVPKGGRNIYIVRDPGDSLVSFYHFLKGVMFEGDVIDLDTFALEFFLAPSASARYWENVRSWWQARDREDVLFLTFEDLKADLRANVERIAAFIGLSGDPELIDLATRQATFEFMRAHESQFDDHPQTLALCRMASFPPARTTKVRAGRIGDREAVSPRIAALLEEEWQRHLAPLGLRAYDELRARLNPRA